MKKLLQAFVRSTPLVLALTLSACQSPPPATPGLSSQQVQVLREYGFEQTDEGWELQMPGKLLFDFNVDKLSGEQKANVEKMARSLHSVGITHLRVEGHTDDVGADAYNEQLSLRRAQAVAQVLINAGIPQTNISVQGYGNSKPLPANNTSALRKENRRVAVIVPVQ